MINYSLLLAAGIWLFFLANMLMPLPAGRGIGYLADGKLVLDFPSWRASFLGKRIAIISPWRMLGPLIQVSLRLPASDYGAAVSLQALREWEQALRSVRLLLALLLALLLIAMPLSLLAWHSDLAFIALAGFAYALYALIVLCLYRIKSPEHGRLIRQHWKAVFEPFLCLPYAGRLLSKLYAAAAPVMSLADILDANLTLSGETLTHLSASIAELRDMLDDQAQIAHLDRLQQQLAACRA